MAKKSAPTKAMSEHARDVVDQAKKIFYSLGGYAESKFGSMTRYLLSNGFDNSEIDAICWHELAKRAGLFNKEKSRIQTFVHIVVRSALKRQIETMNSTIRKCPTKLLSIYDEIDGSSFSGTASKIVDILPAKEVEFRHGDQEKFNAYAVGVLTKCLLDTQSKIISLRFPMDGSDPMSIREVSEVLKLSPMAVHYAEQAAFRRMRELAKRYPEILNNILPA